MSRSTAKKPSLRPPCVWAVGGGKGGVGKSVVTANLAIAFAQRFERVALVDADFGGANLHTVLGMSAPERGLPQFLGREVNRLADVLTPTPIPNLSIISGAKCAPEAANLLHNQKLRLIRQLRSLPVDHVFVDLSAGSAYNALDLFLEADQTLLVVAPERTSIENAYQFLRAAFFRSMRQAVRRSHCRDAIQAALETRSRQGIRSARELVAQLTNLDPDMGQALEERVAAFRPQVIVNQARTPKHRSLASHIAATTQEYLGATITPLGTLPRDENVIDSLARGRPVSKSRPGCPFVVALKRIAAELHDSASPQESPKPLQPARPRDDGPGVTEPGAHLRHCREHLGLSIDDLHRFLRIRQLEQIEAERFDELPAETYTRAFVLQYAKALGIPERHALADRFAERFREARS